MAGVKSDVLIVGGGPAGLAAAIAARLKGFTVTVADIARPPIDKACGEGLLPAAPAALAQIGVRISMDNAFAFRGIRFIGENASVEANFPVGTGWGIRRTRLHQLLCDRAREVGVRMLWGVSTHSLDDLAAGRWIIGADGQNSRIRCLAGLDAASKDSARFGFRRHYQIEPWTDCVEVHWASGFQIYITPVASNEVGIALLTRDRRQRVEQALASFPQLQRRLAGAAFSSVERGAITRSRRLRRVVSGRTALIGDASGSADAITGEGLSLAFQQANALAGALAAGDLEAYQAAHRRLSRKPLWMADVMLLLDRSPWLRRQALRTMSLRPEIFGGLLALHAGRPSLALATT
ncbi:MAG TPA: FAD-dependent monooxygenase [Bryobacteraceae bacterium]